MKNLINSMGSLLFSVTFLNFEFSSFSNLYWNMFPSKFSYNSNDIVVDCQELESGNGMLEHSFQSMLINRFDFEISRLMGQHQLLIDPQRTSLIEHVPRANIPRVKCLGQESSPPKPPSKNAFAILDMKMNHAEWLVIPIQYELQNAS